MSSSTAEQIQDRLAAAIAAYAEAVEAEGSFPPIRSEHEVSATAAAITASALIEAAEIEPFELSMWRSWGLR
jgi:hypothetical protein